MRYNLWSKRDVMISMKEDHTGKTIRGDEIMRIIVGISLATSFLVVPLALGKPIGGTSLISLADSLAPLKERFNAAVDKPRVLAILSPT